MIKRTTEEPSVSASHAPMSRTKARREIDRQLDSIEDMLEQLDAVTALPPDSRPARHRAQHDSAPH